MGSRGWGVFTGAEVGVAMELKSVVVAVVRVNVTGVDREWCRTAGAELLRSCLEAGVGVLVIMESALLVEVGTLDIDTRRRTLSNVCRGAEIREQQIQCNVLFVNTNYCGICNIQGDGIYIAVFTLSHTSKWFNLTICSSSVFL